VNDANSLFAFVIFWTLGGEMIGQPQLFITYQQLVANSKNMNDSLLALRASTSTVNQSQDDRLYVLYVF
jgi:hypothetical protein